MGRAQKIHRMAVPPSPSKLQQASSPTTEEPAWKGTYRGKYQVMHTGIGLPNEGYSQLHERLETLAAQLGISTSTVVWSAIHLLLANPPSSAHELPREVLNISTGRNKPRQHCPGFLLVHHIDPLSKRSTKVRVAEVQRQSAIPLSPSTYPRTFFKYDPEAPDARLKALRQANRAAVHDATLMSIPCETIPLPHGTPTHQEQPTT